MASGALAMLFVTAALISAAAAYETFDDLFFINFGEQNTKVVGEDEVQLSLTTSTGSYTVLQLRFPASYITCSFLSVYFNSCLIVIYILMHKLDLLQA